MANQESDRKIRLAILISGRGSNMFALRDALSDYDEKAEIILIAADKQCAGITLAQAEDLPCLVVPYHGRPKAEAEAELIDALKSAEVDIIILAGFMRILSADFVAEFDGRIINIHPSLLPHYKGLHTHYRTLDAGDSHHGASVHLVNAELDDGPILLQASIAIHKDDTAKSLAMRLLPLEHWLYCKVITGLVSGELVMTKSGGVWQSPVTVPAELGRVTICPQKPS